MDRFALFVDAGYLLAAGGELCCGTKRRHEVECDYDALHSAAVGVAADHCGLFHLRTYWYDGGLGPHSQPTVDQLTIAALPRVKVRLGRVIKGQQKGVDSMITRDIMTLARERAIDIAFLLSGDEDLREGVLAAQECGVQVILVGIPARRGVNQSFTLINECDDHLLLPEQFLAPHFRTVMHDAPSAPLIPAIPRGETEAEVARTVGIQFAEAWLREVELETATLVASRFPLLPKDLDAQVLRAAEATLGSLRDREALRKGARNGFVDTINSTLEAQ